MRLTMDVSTPTPAPKRSLTPTRQDTPQPRPTITNVTSPRSASPFTKNAKSRNRPSSPSKKTSNNTSSRPSSPSLKPPNNTSRPSSPSKKTPVSNSSTSPTPSRQIPNLPMPSSKVPSQIASFSTRRRLSLDTISTWKKPNSSSTSSSPSPSLLYSTISPRRSSAQATSFFLPSSPSYNSLADLQEHGRRSSQGDLASDLIDKDEDDKILEMIKASRRRASQADIMLRASQVDLLMNKTDKKNSLSSLKARQNKGNKSGDGKKECYVLVNLDEEETVVLTCRDEQHLKSILTAALMDRRVHSYRLVVASTRAIFKVDQGISRRVRSCEDLLESSDFSGLDDLGVEEEINDERFHLTREFLEQERYYCDKLQSLFEIYAEPLRKFSSLSREDHQIMFVPIEPLFSISASLLAKLETVLDSWNSDTSKLGNLFSTKFWNYYQEYLSIYPDAKRLLTEKYKTDPAFEEFCELRLNQGRLSIDALLSLPVKRVPDFDRYLSALLEETDPSHNDYEDICRAAKRVHSMVKEKEDDLYEVENQAAMDSVQERFPQDDLQLSEHIPSLHHAQGHINDNNNINNNNNNNNNNNDDKETTGHITYNKNKNDNNTDKSDISDNMDNMGTKTKRLSLRRRSAPSAVLFKSLSGSRSKSTTSLWSNAGMGKRDSDNVLNSQAIRIDADTSRMFLMEGSVQLATGMQTQERYMFLFNDLLLLAKQKSNTTYKLKHRIQLCDMWIASCVDEVCEITRATEKSFVIGWPTTNAAVTFPSVDEKDKWLRILVDGITKEKLKDEGTTLQLKVSPRDIQSSKTACQMTITNETKADDVLVQCLKQMNIADTNASDYQLWVSSGKEGTPYPLIGHETPFSIKRNQLREVTRSKSRDDINTMTSGDVHSSILDGGGTSKEKCDFYIKQKKGQKKQHLEDPSYQKKKFKSPNIFSKLASKIGKAKPQVFKQSLSECFTENNYPPDSIMKLMVLIYEKGPHINGIMRRGNNHALGKEIREKIESGQSLSLEDHQTPTAASVFKDFLRCIPGGLLTSKLEVQWMAISKDHPTEEKITRIREILGLLPPQHHRLLTLTICLLQHIAKHKELNKMSPTNLATCIAPSFCSDSNPKPLPGKLNADSLIEVHGSMMAITNIITPLITFMITKHVEIFGEEILNAFVPFGCAASPPVTCLEDELVRDHIGSGNNGMINAGVEDEGDEEMFEDDEIPLRRHTKIHPTTRQSNSGTDSDSTHSVLSMADNGVMMRRDDSSIDSLVDRDYYPADSSPTVVKSHLSPSNLSRDSGLTLSDTQLYEEDGDLTITGGKMYQRSASHDDDLESNDMGLYDPNIQRRQEPVPPPRSSRARKSRSGGYRSDGMHEPHSFSSGPSGHHHKPAPFLHSASTTALDFLPSAFSKSARPDLMSTSATHSPLGKRISSDSIGEEDESGSGMQLKKVDFSRIRKDSDMGTIVKSESGTHLFLKDELQPSKYSLESGQRIIGKDRYLRQSSATDSTPPMSPQSRYSQSSRDSFVSNSNYSTSQESPGHSAPQTPDSLNDKPLTWSIDQDKTFKTIDHRLTQSLNINYAHNLSKSTPNIAKDIDFNEEEDDTDDDDHQQFTSGTKSSTMHSGGYEDQWSDKYVQKYKPSHSTHWRSKSHEAEEVESKRRPNFSLLIRSEDQEFSGTSKSNSLPTSTDKHQSLLKGSPPPNVLLKSLQGPTRRESVPARPSDGVASPHYRRSSADTVTHPPFNPSKSLSGPLRIDEEYSNATSKPIMISPNSQDNQSSTSRAKLSRYVVSSVDLRPDKPPCYQQTLQRQFMLKQNVPVDIDMDDKQKQRENSYNAKAMYEKSLRLYNEQRIVEPENVLPSAKPSISSEPNTNSSFSSSDFVDSKRSKFTPVINQSVNSYSSYPLDVSHSGGASKDLSGSPVTYDDSGASGFIDLGSISNSLQEDIVKRRNAHAGTGQNISGKGQNTSNSVSISRTDSKLSDTGSSSGSSVTLSTLSRHSDSFGRRSDISNVSNVTVSSATSESSSENSIMSHRKSNSSFDNHNMSYSRHFRPVEPDNDDDSEEEVYEEEEHYVILKKDPQAVYQESIKKFEQVNAYLYQPSAAQPSLASSSPSSSSSSTYSLTPRSSIDHSVESKTNIQHSVSKPTAQRTSSSGLKRSEPLPNFNRQDSQTNQKTNNNTNNNNNNNNSNVEQSEPAKPEPARKYSLTEMQSDEHHNHFLKVRSLFYNPEDDQASSPAPSPRFPNPNKPQPISPSTTQNIPTNMPSEIPVSITESPQTTSSSHQHLHHNNNNNNNNDNDNNSRCVNTNVPSPTIESKELPWNVKKLKKLFDKDSAGISDHSIGSIQVDSTSHKPSSGASGSRRSPPPYHNPPPFRRLHDDTRLSTSSNSSAGSENVHSKSNTGHYRKGGPQASAKDHIFNSSYSSSEESYNSYSYDKRSRKSSLQDSDSAIDFSNITYV